jgi:hypothetical protein
VSSVNGAVYADHFAKRVYDLMLIACRLDRPQGLTKEIKKAHEANLGSFPADPEKDSDVAKIAHLRPTNPAERVPVVQRQPFLFMPLEQALVQESIVFERASRASSKAEN